MNPVSALAGAIADRIVDDPLQRGSEARVRARASGDRAAVADR
jgi:hypothetical protein